MRMRNLFLLLLLFLAACRPAASATVEATAPSAIPPLAGTATPSSPGCRKIELQPTPRPEDPSHYPPPNATDFFSGPAQAPVTLLYYADFQCTPCAQLALALRSLQARQPQEIRLVFRLYPLPEKYDKTLLASMAALAAARQGHFWEMHDWLFANQKEWASLSVEGFTARLEEAAQSMGIDMEAFHQALTDPSLKAEVQARVPNAETSVLVPYLPFLFLNGQIYTGPLSEQGLQEAVALILLGRRQFACPPQVIAPGKRYEAILQTEKGDIRIRLLPEKAPIAVNSFVFLARQGWYDNITFHRVIPGFVAQSGDPSGTGQGIPGYLFVNEIAPDLRFDRPGVVGLANSGPDTNGSQFFITYAPAPHLDGYYTIFGYVVSGMDVLLKLTPRDPQANPYAPPGDRLIHVEIEEY
jgi:cyclophilin family peptidyl-prolyl cis-trans isomerase/protein-disulfide isomerase